ncbi:hypothetical protein C2845_PM01G19120 [Panicum miliaceum]|uniref:Uncharacterized protein n=1 Tax=Panicum miliaceum TaxID=4540 RepID=A0A3L6TPT0_PANMI|nr:hypothetical protein C2845_PM01G19120 [Panicum miliaceum]
MDEMRVPSSLRHACPCDLILGDEEMEWWWSCLLNRRETMSWRVAAADMRAQEELLFACRLKEKEAGKVSMFTRCSTWLCRGMILDSSRCSRTGQRGAFKLLSILTVNGFWGLEFLDVM